MTDFDPAEAQPHGQELPQLRDQGASRRSTIDVTRWIRPDEKTHPFTAAFSEPISRHPPVSSFAEAPRRTSRRTSRRRACASIELLTWDASRPAGRPSPSLALFPLPQTDPFPIPPHPAQEDGREITLEPGLILGEVNRLLAKYKQTHGLDKQYKMGPDPSSIDSCMIGGVVANNSSGMCCGVKQNTYHTLKDMRIVFVDGTVLDTSDEASRAAFLKSHAKLVEGIVDLAKRVQADEQLSQLIRKKHAIKCTTGYSMNALVDHPVDDSIEIIKRLMIGSEGTLGFVSQATYNTVIDHPHKASAFIVFKDVREACRAAAVLRRETDVDAVELFRPRVTDAVRGHEQIIGLVPTIADAPKTGAALLIECRGATDDELNSNIKAVTTGRRRQDGLSERPRVYVPFRQGRGGVQGVLGRAQGSDPSRRLLSQRRNFRAHRGCGVRGGQARRHDPGPDRHVRTLRARRCVRDGSRA